MTDKLKHFQEEKREYLEKGELETSLMSVDTCILGLLFKTNKLPFAYSFYQSCSGSPLDHEGKLINSLKWYEDMNDNPSDQKTPSGYLLLRCFTEDFQFPDFKHKILTIPNTIFKEVKIQPFETERVDYIKSFLMQMKFLNEEDPLLRWHQYHKILNDFV